MSYTLFDKNIEALKNKNFPYDKLLEQRDRYKTDNTFEFVAARDKNPILKHNGEKTLSFNSTYRPIDEAKKWAEEYNTGELNKITLLFGIGSGYQVEQLITDLTNNDRIIIYEPSVAILFRLIENRDITSILENEKVFLIVEGINDDIFRKTLAIMIKWFNLERTRIIDLPQYTTVFPEQYKNVLINFKKEVDAQIGNTTTLIYRAEDRIGNVICNLNKVSEINVIDELIGKFNNEIPFIVVSAGPSLSKNIDLLKQAKNKAFICATDTAAKVMMKKGIEPDLYICIDPIKFDILDIDDDNVWDLPVIGCLTSHYKLIEKSKGKIFLYDSGHDVLNKILKLKNQSMGYLASGGSVAHNAFALGRFLDFKRIVLIGQDLAFTNNKTHSDGAFNDISVSEQVKNNQLYVEDVNGDQILTRYDFKSYLDWFEREIALLKDQVEVIDATEGGARIHGTTIMTLQEVIDKYCTVEEKVSEKIRNIENLFNDEDSEFVKKEIEKLRTRIKTLSDKAIKAKKANNKRYEYFKKKQFGNPKFRKAEDDLEKLDRFIDESKDMIFINDLIMGAEYKMVSESVGLEEDDPEAIRIRVENKNTLYDQIQMAVKRVLTTFDKVKSGTYSNEVN